MEPRDRREPLVIKGFRVQKVPKGEKARKAFRDYQDRRVWMVVLVYRVTRYKLI